MKIEKIYIVGGGLMGAGIAQVAITEGYSVTLNDLSADILEKSRIGIDKMLSKSVQKERMKQEEKDAAMARLTLSDKLDSAASADLVIEAIVEKAELKKTVFTTLSDICREDAILASNTSSISISELSSVVKNPARFVGMHFFSPVPFMKLLEIVGGVSTSEETIAAAKEIGARLGKTCIVSKDSPAFIVNRLLVPMINEAVWLLESGIGSTTDIDAGATCGLNHPMGPLELADMTGIDIAYAALEVIHTETGDPKYRPALLFRKMVNMGWLGRKTGKGFYIYHEDGTKTVNADLL